MTEAEILRSLVTRIEAVREERKLLGGSERDLFAEAKSKNIDGKALRRVLQRRAMDDADREAFDDLVDQYEHALGSKAAVRAAVRSGASVRQAAAVAGVTHGVAERAARGVPKNANHGTDRAGNDDGVPEGRLAGEEPAVPAPIPEPSAGAAPYATDCDPVAAAVSPRAVPAGDLDGGPDSAGLASTNAAALREGQDSASKPDDGDGGIDAGWEKRDGEGNHAEAVRAVREGIEEHGKDYPTALRQRLEAAINDLGGDPKVADIARRTLALYESGDVHGAAIIVDAVKRGATYPEIPASLLRRQAPAPRAGS